MTDRYLFRGKTKQGEWKYGYLYITQSGKYEIGCYNEMVKMERITHIVIPETIGQYTGLTDKNGKRIFDGDVVKADDFIFAVKYGKCGGVANADNYGYMGFYLEPFSEATKLHAKYGLRNDICYFDNIEIINNIHDSGELLKGE